MQGFPDRYNEIRGSRTEPLSALCVRYHQVVGSLLADSKMSNYFAPASLNCVPRLVFLCEPVVNSLWVFSARLG